MFATTCYMYWSCGRYRIVRSSRIYPQAWSRWVGGTHNGITIHHIQWLFKLRMIYGHVIMCIEEIYMSLPEDGLPTQTHLIHKFSKQIQLFINFQKHASVIVKAALNFLGFNQNEHRLTSVCHDVYQAKLFSAALHDDNWVRWYLNYAVLDYVVESCYKFCQYDILTWKHTQYIINTLSCGQQYFPI